MRFYILTTSLLLKLFITPVISQKNIVLPLNEGWNVKPSSIMIPSNSDEMGGNIDLEGYTCNLPNSALNVLFEKKVIEDPFFGINEKKLHWLDTKEWIFEKHFDAPNGALNARHVVITLKGLDTYADVYLNDLLIAKGNNMFRTWQADVATLLRATDNVLRINFASPLSKEYFLKSESAVEFPSIPENTRMFTRKAGYQYGWDWGPAFITPAIGDVSMTLWNDAQITDFNVKQLKVDTQTATVRAILTVDAATAKKVNVIFNFAEQTVTLPVQLNVGLNKISREFTVNKPKLWWTHNLGEPYMYDISAQVLNDSGINVEKKMRIGLRSLSLVRDKDAKGETFYFKLNGIPVFAKGANLIPLDFFTERVDSARTKQIVNAARDAEMNMLRVWGGGIYQSDYFYDLCDEKGILIWQDFMYACSMYPGDADFLANAKEEANEQTIRLRNHPCIALWCGNNEIDEAWNNWGWQLRYNPDQKEIINQAYSDLFKKILPAAVSENTNTDYYESSPKFGRYNNKSYTEGDAHDWFVWHDEKPFEHFDTHIPRFASEYGFQSLPDWKTIESFTNVEDRELLTPIMLSHQKHPKGNELMKKYMARSYKVPTDFKDFAYVSQLVQAEGISKAIEAQRRNRPYCMGTLFWQLNDVWQGASWSSVDYFGRWKALQYYAREAYRNILIAPVVDKDSFRINIVNDDPKAFNAEIIIRVIDFKGNKYYADGKSVRIDGLSAQMVFKEKMNALLEFAKQSSAFALVSIKNLETDITTERLVYFTTPKDLKLETPDFLTKEFKDVPGGVNIKLKSATLVKNAFFETMPEGWFDKNYLDMAPFEDYTIFFKTTANAEVVKNSFKIKSLIDIK